MLHALFTFTGEHMGKKGFVWVPVGCVYACFIPLACGKMCLLSEGEANESSPQSFAVSFLRLCGYLGSSSLTSPPRPPSLLTVFFVMATKFLSKLVFSQDDVAKLGEA